MLSEFSLLFHEALLFGVDVSVYERVVPGYVRPTLIRMAKEENV